MDKKLLKQQTVVVRMLYWLRMHTTNSKLCRWLEKKMAAKSGGYAYNDFIRAFYLEEHGLEIGYGTYGGCWNNSGLWWQNKRLETIVRLQQVFMPLPEIIDIIGSQHIRVLPIPCMAQYCTMVIQTMGKSINWRL